MLTDTVDKHMSQRHFVVSKYFDGRGAKLLESVTALRVGGAQPQDASARGVSRGIQILGRGLILGPLYIGIAWYGELVRWWCHLWLITSLDILPTSCIAFKCKYICA